jgi:molybdate transport system substrate-binding protein
MRRCALAFLVLLAALVGGCGGDDSRSSSTSTTAVDAGGPLVVSAASSLTDALEQYGQQFDDGRARFSFAGSDELAAQIRQGVKPDVFASANTSLPADLHAEGLVGPPQEFAANRLVLAVPAGETAITSVDDLAEPGVKIAVGSATVPIGAYTRKVLDRLPAAQRDKILANVRSEEPDVKGIVGKLTQGAVDAGLVYVTDVTATDGALRAIELPAELEPSVAYAAAVVDGAKHPAAAQRFIDGLVHGAGQDALRAAGFAPPPR